MATQAFDFGPDSFKGRNGPASWFGSFIVQTARQDLERQVVRALEGKKKARVLGKPTLEVNDSSQGVLATGVCLASRRPDKPGCSCLTAKQTTCELR